MKIEFEGSYDEFCTLFGILPSTIEAVEQPVAPKEDKPAVVAELPPDPESQPAKASKASGKAMTQAEFVNFLTEHDDVCAKLSDEITAILDGTAASKAKASVRKEIVALVESHLNG